MFVSMYLYIHTPSVSRFTNYKKWHSPSFGIPLETDDGDFDVGWGIPWLTTVYVK